MGREWRLIEEGRAPGAWNMAVDEALLEAARRDEALPTLRFYGWSRPTLSLGRHQEPRAGIDDDFRRRSGIDRVRRPTGGRAVLHDREVTYSIVLPASLARGAGVGEVYRVLSGALLAGLAQVFGVRCSVFGKDRSSSQDPRPKTQNRTPNTEHRTPNTASCFATAAGGDGLAAAGKLVGSAQARRAGAVLQHGSVLLEVRRGEWQGLFGAEGLEVALADLIGAAPGEGAVRVALRRGLEGRLEAAFAPGALTEREWSEAERLVAERYGVGSKHVTLVGRGRQDR
jgi:lipoate-protein ligase A